MKSLHCLLLAAALQASPAYALEAEPLPTPLPEPAGEPKEAQETHWEGAIGILGSFGPTYQGSSAVQLKFSPGFFLRYGRFTVTNASGFVTRRADDVIRGLGVDLSPSDRLRVNLALRVDRGRSDNNDPALQGLGDINPTVRARLAATWRLEDGWRLGGSWSIDALGNGGGGFGDVSVVRERRLSAETTISWGGALTVGSRRYMQSYFGISEEQAARTGYPVYAPGAGLRDVSVFFNFRSDLTPTWVAIGGIGASRLVDKAAGSPLTLDPDGWGINCGLAWRF